QITCIGLRNGIDLIAVNDDKRGIGAAKVSVTQLDAATGHHGRRMLAHCILENLRQAAGGPASYCRLERSLHGLVEVAHAGAMLGRNEMNIGELNKEQAPLKLRLHVIALAWLHAVPLVQGDNQCPAAFEDKAEQVQVVLNHALTSIHDKDHY